MQEREKELRRRLRADFAHYAEKCLKVRGKQGWIVPFLLNDAQRHIHAALEEQRRETGRVRAVILKGRQQGCSTYVQGRFYWRLTHQRGARAFILTHLDEASRNIYGIVRRFHDNCPPLVRPRASQANARALVFDRLDGSYRVGTARSQGVGRSDTVQFFHGSEVAYWQHAESHVTGILQTVPDMDGTEIVLESTSAGPFGFFYDLCQSARRGDSDYIFIFVPWFWQQEYRRDPPPMFILSEDEKGLRDRHGLDAAQLFWRRAKIAELGGVHRFRREYPATPDEAFQADHPRALWQRDTIERNRVARADVPELRRVVVAVDPAVTAHVGSDETGIIVAGCDAAGHAYVLDDLSGVYAPSVWAQRVIDAYYAYAADRVVAEVNQGGDLVEQTLRALDPDISYKAVRASRGKVARAEPVAALDSSGRVHHAAHLHRLEDQMCSFDPQSGASPDRVDARTWAVTELLLQRRSAGGPLIWQG